MCVVNCYVSSDVHLVKFIKLPPKSLLLVLGEETWKPNAVRTWEINGRKETTFYVTKFFVPTNITGVSSSMFCWIGSDVLTTFVNDCNKDMIVLSSL